MLSDALTFSAQYNTPLSPEQQKGAQTQMFCSKFFRTWDWAQQYSQSELEATTTKNPAADRASRYQITHTSVI
jgi:hypothetical protein